MHINNLKETDLLKSSLRFKSCIGKYLIKMDIPILHNDGDYLYFSKTQELLDAIEKLPLHIRLFYKWGEGRLDIGKKN